MNNKYDVMIDSSGSMTQPFLQQYYQIHVDWKEPIEAPRPDTLPEAGDILVFTAEWHTPTGQIYSIGDEVHLMHRTNEAPWGKRSELGNWVAISKLGVSVWANIEWLMADGHLKSL